MTGTIGIHPRRVYASSYMTSLNAPGFSLSLLNISRIESSVPGANVYALLDAPTEAPAWSGVCVGWQNDPYSNDQDETLLADLRDGHGMEGRDQNNQAEARDGSYWRDADISVGRVESTIRGACTGVLSATDDMTDYDTVVGDGDCGETFAAGAKGQHLD